MDEGLKETIKFFGFMLSIFLVFVFIIIGGSYINYSGDLNECKNYDTYGYYTEINANFWESKFKGEVVCLITMEDGTKLPLNDYKTMSIKNAKVR